MSVKESISDGGKCAREIGAVEKYLCIKWKEDEFIVL